MLFRNVKTCIQRREFRFWIQVFFCENISVSWLKNSLNSNIQTFHLAIEEAALNSKLFRCRPHILTVALKGISDHFCLIGRDRI